jgi:hypothetical protein
MDLRVSSGSFFVLLGGILLVLGIFSPDLRAPLTELNVNLYSGALMFAFGAALLILARRGARHD